MRSNRTNNIHDNNNPSGMKSHNLVLDFETTKGRINEDTKTDSTQSRNHKKRSVTSQLLESHKKKNIIHGGHHELKRLIKHEKNKLYSSEAYKQQEIIDNQEILSIRPLITEHQGAPFKVKLYYGGKPVFLKSDEIGSLTERMNQKLEDQVKSKVMPNLKIEYKNIHKSNNKSFESKK